MEFSGNEKRLNNDIVKDYYLFEISSFLLIFAFINKYMTEIESIREKIYEQITNSYYYTYMQYSIQDGKFKTVYHEKNYFQKFLDYLGIV